MATVLVTGGAGFVGSSLALAWKRDVPGDRVIALDNLKRRGSELNLPRLAAAGVGFAHGDVRCRGDLEAVGDVDLILECSAEPSALGGYDGDPRYLFDTNLGGTLNCLELARARKARLVFLSTSRVYPIAALRALPLQEGPQRLSLAAGASGPGWSEAGIAESFPLEGARTLYGSSKLASELFIGEYSAAYGLEAVVNRCGVIAGPWQMGKVDQGFVALWAAQFLYGGRLGYIGFGGQGKQVRDILHVADLYDLIRIQAGDFRKHGGRAYNVGGGAANSLSLLELSGHCAALTGNSLRLDSVPDTHPADVPYYVTDNACVTRETGWSPKRSVADILADVTAWLRDNRAQLEGLLKRT